MKDLQLLSCGKLWGGIIVIWLEVEVGFTNAEQFDYCSLKLMGCITCGALNK